MASISSVDARRLVTKELIDVYRETAIPTSLLSSFFIPRESNSRVVSVEVERDSENIAVDVIRGTEGNRNTIDRFTERVIEPPYYREYFDVTQLYFYDQLFGRGDMEVDGMTFATWMEEMSRRIMKLQMKIQRSIEKQASEVLQTGIVLLNKGTNIDFKRKATSLVNLQAGNYWDETGVDPIPSIEAGCNFLRQEGKAMGGDFIMILGQKAQRSLLANQAFKELADYRRTPLVQLSIPQRISDAIGGAFHGQFSAGSYNIMLWTYPQFYDNAAGASIPYVNDRNMILLPMNPRFRLSYAAVPRILRDTRNAEFPELMTGTGIGFERGRYVIGNYIEERTETHVFDVKSAPICIPTAVDQIYTGIVTTA